MRKPFVDFLTNFLAGVGLCVFFAAMLMMVRFYAIGAASPDPTTGRIFPLPAHGTLYVQPSQGHWFYGMLIAFAVLEIASLILRRAGKFLETQ